MINDKNNSLKGVTIAQIVPEMGAGGAEQAVIDVSDGIVNAGGTSLIITNGGARLKEVSDTGGKIILLSVEKKSPFSIYYNNLRIKEVIKNHNVDIIHARSRAPAWSGFWASKACNIPFMTTYHGIYSENNRLKKYYNSVMIQGKAVIANSEYTKNLIENRYPSAPAKIHTVQRGIKLSRFNPTTIDIQDIEEISKKWGLQKNDKVILLPGRYTSWKGHKYAIEAFAKLPENIKNSYKLVMMGDAQGRDEYVNGLKHLTAELGLSNNVIFARHETNMPAALMAADMVLNCASGKPESFGRVAVEAQAIGRPMIVSNLGPTKETVLVPPQCAEEDRTGWHFPENDSTTLSQIIAHVVSLSVDDRCRLALRAREHVLKNFTTEVMVQRTLKVYEELMANKA